MWLKSLTIRNLRSIENIAVSFDQRTNVIVGPNAVGKTTLLEGIRLAKAALAPRTSDETQQAFMSLGAISPHNPLRLNFGALARDPARSVQVSAVSPRELENLDGLENQLATGIVRANIGATGPQGPMALVQYLSSPAGQVALRGAQQFVANGLLAIKAGTTITLELSVEPNGTVRGARLLDQIVFSGMESQLPAHQALFSYFPADRALPSGEVNIQIGGPDITAQLQSHNATPQTKFHRLKPTIVNNFILNQQNRERMLSEL